MFKAVLGLLAAQGGDVRVGRIPGAERPVCVPEFAEARAPSPQR